MHSRSFWVKGRCTIIRRSLNASNSSALRPSSSSGNTMGVRETKRESWRNAERDRKRDQDREMYVCWSVNRLALCSCADRERHLAWFSPCVSKSKENFWSQPIRYYGPQLIWIKCEGKHHQIEMPTPSTQLSIILHQIMVCFGSTNGVSLGCGYLTNGREV